MSSNKAEASAANETPTQAGSRSREMMCTHITMVRMYSDDMRCSMCLHPGPFGWLYRCTQDRELMIEDDYRERSVNAVDDLFVSYTIPTKPKRRSPAARSVPISFLEEMTPEQLQAYTPQEISTLFQQRTHVLDVVNRHSKDLEVYRHREQKVLNPFSIPGTNTLETDKQWVPKSSYECQFKVCHRCRHMCADRSFLSLDAIANNEIPMTAVAGFGFNLLGKRPVVLRKYAINYGLRPDPRPRTALLRTTCEDKGLGIGVTTAFPDQSTEPIPCRRSPFDDDLGADTTFGQSSNAYDSSAMTRSLNLESTSESKITRIELADRYELRRVLVANMKLAAKTSKIDAEGDNLVSHTRPAHTPPNSPRLRKAELDNAREKHPMLFRGRSDKSFHTNIDLRSIFNLDDTGVESEEDKTALSSEFTHVSSKAISESYLNSNGISPLSTATAAMELHHRDTRESAAELLQVGNSVALSDVISQI